jgi:Helix-turn-helix domain
MNERNLLTPAEVDRIFRYPRGRVLRLVRAGKFPHIELPDGEIRIDRATVDAMLTHTNESPSARGVAHA